MAGRSRLDPTGVLVQLFQLRRPGVWRHVLWLFPRFLALYTSLGGLNFLLLRCLTWGGVGPLWAQALLLPVLAVGGFAGMRIFVFRRAKPGVPA